MIQMNRKRQNKKGKVNRMTGSFFKRRWLALLVSFLLLAPLAIPVLPIAAADTILWQFGTTGEKGTDSSHLDDPHGAEWLPNGNVLIADSFNNRVIEVNSYGNIVWQYGNGVAGSGANRLYHPYDAKRLENDNTLIADRDNNRVIEVDSGKNIVWQYGGHYGPDAGEPDVNVLKKPYEAERLPDPDPGDGIDERRTLIADRENYRVIEVRGRDYNPDDPTPAKGYTESSIVWQYGTTGVAGGWQSGKTINYLDTAVDANRLPNGNTLITDCWNSRVIEVKTSDYDPTELINSGYTQASIVWQYGTTRVKGSGFNQLHIPLDAERLPNGNILISDTNWWDPQKWGPAPVPMLNDRVIEVDYDTKEIVWQYGTGESGSGENQLRWPYSAKRTLTGETLITDRMNHRVILVQDNTPPTVTSTTPLDLESGVSVSTGVTATFSEAMAAPTVTGSTFILSDGSDSVPAAVAYDVANKKATLNPLGDLSYSTTYTATVTTGAKDLARNPLSSVYSWTFTTAALPDVTPPTVASTSPTADQTGVGIAANVSATFSEAIDPATINTSTFSLAGGGTPVPGGVSYDAGTQTTTLNPNSDLAYSTTYTATISTTVTDLAGNPLASNKVWSFTTESAPTSGSGTGTGSTSGGGGGTTSGGGGGGGDDTSSPATAAASDAYTGEIYGRVISSISGWGIPGTAVRAGNQVVPTEPTGEFRITNLRSGIYTVYYDAPGFISQTQELILVSPGLTASPPAVIMSPAVVAGVTVASGVGEIFGRVVNTADQPIRGAAVRIDNTVIPTNSGGEFRFTMVNPGIYTIYYDAPGYVGQTQIIIVTTGNTVTPPKVVLDALGQISGRVVNESGRPMSGVAVRIDATTIPTNSRGEFRFTQVRSGIYTVNYEAAGYRKQVQEYIAVTPNAIVNCPTVIMGR
jgi:hypothetical protein